MFDLTTGCYNLNARTLSKFRQAKANAVAGKDHLHISVLGDSTTMQASYTNPAYVEAWPARMRDYLMRNLGLSNCGTGLMGLWDLFGAWNFTNSPVFPHFSWQIVGTGTLTKEGPAQYGVYGYNGVRIFSGSATGPFTSLKLMPVGGQVVDEIWLYMLGDGNSTFVEVSDGTITYKFQIPPYFGASITPLAGYTVAPCIDGYTRATPASSGGLRVAKLSVPRKSNWTATIHAATGSGTYLTMVEARDSWGTLRVSNLAQGGMTLAGMIAATDTVGYGGMNQGLDVPKADLAIIALGINDWLGHKDVATFKANLTAVVLRQQSSAPTGINGSGTAAGGSVMLAIMPTPDLARYPATGGNIPPITDYWDAIYQVADEQDVALIDHTWRWVSYANSTIMYRTGDGIHPNPGGHADLGVAIGSVLAGI